MKLKTPSTLTLPNVPAVDGAAYLRTGQILAWTGTTTRIESPMQQRHLGDLAALTADEALQALAAARHAWNNGLGAWPTSHPNERIAALEKFVARMRAKVKDLSTMLCWEIAKPFKDAEKEITRTIEYIDLTIAAYKEMEEQSNIIKKADGFMAQIRRSPLGVCLVMGPYNYPINETFCLLMPALIMGNPVVIKGARFGALTLQLMLEDFRDCFPAGVINTINGDGPTVIGPLMASGDVNVLAFIGSARASRGIRAPHPRPNRLRCILGLEAKNVAIVCPDADLDLAVAECATGALSYNGQRCTAIKLILAHERIREAFTQKLLARVDALVAGYAFDPEANITPMPSVGEVQRLQKLMATAVTAGARILGPTTLTDERGAAVPTSGPRVVPCGVDADPRAASLPAGEVVGGTDSDGTLLIPAVLGDVTLDMEIAKVEQFGPIVPIAGWSEPATVLDYLSNGDLGQQLALFTSSPEIAGWWIDHTAQLQCRLNLNSQCQRGPDVFPFTGRKDSAEGTLSISDALRCFSIRSMVAVKKTPANVDLAQDILSKGTSNFFSTRVIL
jgi:glyceraldehyde-3-phosphate dehydrogenase (NADP+)